MRILHCVEGLSTASGGPSRTVTALCDALAGETKLDVTLCSQLMPGETPVAAASGSQAVRRLVGADAGIRRRFGAPLSALVRQIIIEGKPAIVHDHGLWTPPHHTIASLCRKHDIPLVLHPRGMFESWALNWHAWRKQIAWRVYVHRDLLAVSLFIATATPEAESIRRLGFKQPIACIANGVFLPDTVEIEQLRAVLLPSSTRTALFLGRIHPIKGVFNLLTAWARLRPAGWRLILAGPDEGGHDREVAAKIRESHLEESVFLAGEARGSVKARLFAETSLFILPSFSENFGVVVAEALSYGLPVVTTTGTPWRKLIEYDCGWWVAPEVDAITESLRQACAMPVAELRQMGERGRVLAARYDWRGIASQTAAAYRWLLSGGTKPDWVYTD
jgi:glycosyltransferase involved in cell wall biosynthesis